MVICNKIDELVGALKQVEEKCTISSGVNGNKGSLTIDPVTSSDLGSKEFMSFYGVKYPLYTGAMAKGIASADLVCAAGKRGILASFGAGGLPLAVTEKALDQIQEALPNGPYAVNLIHSPFDDFLERDNVEMLLRRKVHIVEASAFTQITKHVVRYRVAGLKRINGQVVSTNKLLWKLSRTELAEMALVPPPQNLIDTLLKEGHITPEQAEMSKSINMADDVVVESDSGGHTDNRPIHVIFPLIVSLRNRLLREGKSLKLVRVGVGGGIGCPKAVHGAFAMGAAFVLTGTVNQISRQSGSSDPVRKKLAVAKYSDVTMAPAADMFDEGVQLQVLKKGLMFPARAKKLYYYFCKYDSLDSIPKKEFEKLEKRVFQKNVAQVWEETRDFYITRLNDREKVDRAEHDPKLKMSLVFRWYLGLSSVWARFGVKERGLDYQVWCGPCIGTYNAFVKNSILDPEVAKEFPCVVQINLHLLRGCCFLRRVEQLRKTNPENLSSVLREELQFLPSYHPEVIL